MIIKLITFLSDRLSTFTTGTCDAIHKLSPTRQTYTPQYRPMPPIKDWNTQSRKLKTANSCQISRTVTWRRISPTVWLSYGVLQKLWKSKRQILTRCLRGARRKCTKNISWTHSSKAKISLHPEHRRDTDSLLWNPSCRHLTLRVRLYSKSYLPLVVLELLTAVGDELNTVITNFTLVLDVNILLYETCYGIWYQKRYFDCYECCCEKNK